jgi:hypothetical protein
MGGTLAEKAGPGRLCTEAIGLSCPPTLLLPFHIPQQDGWIARHCCKCLGSLAPLLLAPAAAPAGRGSEAAAAVLSRCHSVLCRVMLSRGLGEKTW